MFIYQISPENFKFLQFKNHREIVKETVSKQLDIKGKSNF